MAVSDDPVAELVGRLRDVDVPAGTMVGEYRVEHKLGEGGMASVFAAVHPLIGKRAAVKVISRKLCADLHAVERFVHEARAVHQIGHPNIVDTFAFGTLPDGRAYYLMEWLPGESLGDRLARGPMALPDALTILDQICDALEAAHANGVVHRDLKPDNVMVLEGRATPTVKLVDFGIAKLAAFDVTMPRTRSGTAMGTPGYMSPEQARGKVVDDRTDVYALGAMTFEMVLGRLPFEGESGIDVLAKHLTEAPPVPRTIWPEIPVALEASILAMLEKEPARRPTIADVRKMLGTLRGRPLPQRRRQAPWSKLALPAAATALAAVGLLTLVQLRHPTVAPAPLPTPAPALAPPVAVPPLTPPTLVVQTPVPGAMLQIDGRPAPIGAPVTLDRAGTHEISMTAPKHRALAQKIEVAPGQRLELQLRLERAPDGKPKKPARTRSRQGDYTLDPFE